MWLLANKYEALSSNTSTEGKKKKNPGMVADAYSPSYAGDMGG
jgi:hypothetical protein